MFANGLILTEESFIFSDESGTPSSYENIHYILIKLIKKMDFLM